MNKVSELTEKSNSPTSRREYIERLRLLYSSTIPAVMGIYVSTIVLVYILSSKLPSYQLYSWMGFMLVVGALRLFLYLVFKRKEKAYSYKTWRNQYVFASFLIGLGWTYITLFFLPLVDTVYQLTIAIVIITYLAGMMTTQYPVAISFFAIFTLPTLSLIYVFFKVGSEIHNTIGFMVIILTVFVITAVTRLRLSLIRSLQLRFETEKLNQSLTHEINHRKEIEEVLITAKVEAEKANKAKSEFLSTMSHEIRTPMNGVIGMTSLLKDTPLNEEQKQFVDVIQQSGDAMLKVINDVLDFNKLVSRQIELEDVDFILTDLCSSSISIFSADFDTKDLTMNQQFSPRAQAIYRADAGRIRQILMNLVSNALKFTEHGSITLNIDVEQTRDDSRRVRFEVKDTGIGIPEEKQSSLFERFVQADASITRKYGGTGLGLAICKELVIIMGGDIGVDSQPGTGSLFWFELPMVYVGEISQDEKTDKNRYEADETSAQSNPLRVLVAEDILPNQLVARKMIEKLGHRVDIVANGLEAVEAIKMRPYDLVMMDLQMPQMDGITATREIRSMHGNYADLPIYAMTANVTEEDQQLCLEVGMSGFIPKPIDFKKLKESLKNLLNDRILKLAK